MIGFYMKYIDGDLYMLSILGGVSMMVAYAVTPFVQRLISTKWGFVLMYLVGAVFAAPLLFIDPETTSVGFITPVSVFAC